MKSRVHNITLVDYWQKLWLVAEEVPVVDLWQKLWSVAEQSEMPVDRNTMVSFVE